MVSSDWFFSLPAVAGVGGLAGLLIVRNRPLPPLPAPADKGRLGYVFARGSGFLQLSLGLVFYIYKMLVDRQSVRRYLINRVVSFDCLFFLPAVAGFGGLAGLGRVWNRPLPPLPAPADKGGFG